MHSQSYSSSKTEGSDTQLSLLGRLHNWQDKRSWNEFYRHYHGMVYAIARKYGLTEGEAWDAVQETFIAIAKQSHEGIRFDPQQGSFKSWLLRISRWRILDILRRRRRRAEDTLMSNLPDARGEEFEKLWEKEWRLGLMRTAITRLKLKVSPRQFQIYDFYVLQDMPLAEVCRRLGVNSTQAYLAKHRVGAQLRREIRELGDSMQ